MKMIKPRRRTPTPVLATEVSEPKREAVGVREGRLGWGVGVRGLRGGVCD